MAAQTPSPAARRLRWTTVEEESPHLPGLVERVTDPDFRGIEFLHVRARTIINEVPKASGLPFRFTINTYRGCSHACTYCFARPSHSYLELDPWREFESRIVVKVNAVQRLRAELKAPSWAGDSIAMGTNTDPYQRAEGRYRLTRGIIETLTTAGNPFSLLTKSPLVLRDLDVLAEAARRLRISVNLSVPTLDEEVWRLTEPGTPHPARRLEAVARLTEAGVDSGVMLAPVIPGMSDSPAQIEEVVSGAVEAGATFVTPILLHLRPGVRELFLPWLEQVRPDLLPRYRDLYAQGSYGPKQERARIASLVRRLVFRHGGTRRPSSPPGRAGRHPRGPASAGGGRGTDPARARAPGHRPQRSRSDDEANPGGEQMRLDL